MYLATLSHLWMKTKCRTCPVITICGNCFEYYYHILKKGQISSALLSIMHSCMSMSNIDSYFVEAHSMRLYTLYPLAFYIKSANSSSSPESNGSSASGIASNLFAEANCVTLAGAFLSCVVFSFLELALNDLFPEVFDIVN